MVVGPKKTLFLDGELPAPCHWLLSRWSFGLSIETSLIFSPPFFFGGGGVFPLAILHLITCGRMPIFVFF